MEDRRLLSIDLLSGVSNPLMLGTTASGPSEATSFGTSGDGRYVAFESAATNLVPGDTNGYRDIFVRDQQTHAVTRVSTDSGGAQANNDSLEPALSADGRYLAFVSSASNLVAGDNNGRDDVFVKDLLSGATIRASTDSAGGQATGNSSAPSISSNGRYVAFTSAAINLVGSDTNGSTDVFVKDLVTGATTRVSTDSAGAQAIGDSSAAAISGEGRYVAFASLAGNLAGGDLNTVGDIFVKDLLTGATTRVSTDSAGATANGESIHPSISSDARYVAFSSDATNLVGGDGNLVRDVFVKDRQTGATTRASTSTAGAQATGDSSTPSISGDGRYVAFRSDATDLVAADLNLVGDVFVKDLLGGATTRVSTTSAGAEANDKSIHPAISNDGRYVVFNSDAANLATGDINGFRDVFVKDRQVGTVTLVSPRDTTVAGPFGAGGTSQNPVLSGDGRYVAFSSHAANLTAGDTNNDYDVFVTDILAGSVTRVSTDSSGGQANNDSERPAVTSDGRYVAFCSLATDLVSGDTNGYRDVFRKDLQTGIVTLVSTDSGGAAANGDSSDPVLSADGRYVAFYSTANNLTGGDTNAATDVFLKDLASGAVTRVSTANGGVQANGISDSPAISADGLYVAFRSDATNLVTGDTNKKSDIFLKDLAAGTLARVSTSSLSAQADDDSSHPSITADGRYVVFTSNAANLVASDTNLSQDIFRKDMGTGFTTRVSTNSDGGQSDGDSVAPAINADGRYVVFRSAADNLVAGDANGHDDVYVKDLLVDGTMRVSVATGGTEPNGDSFHPAVSADGRYVAFSSDASNLFAGDGNASTDVFRANNWFTNRAPTGITLSADSVPENQPLGTAVGLLHTVDPDSGDTFLYTFAQGPGSTDNDRFTLVGDELRTAAVFDYEAVTTYNVRIAGTDQGGLSYDQAFVISVTNVNEAPTDIVVSGPIAVAENSAAGTVACNLSTIDPDTGDTHTYSLRDNAGGRFAVQGNQVVVAAGATLDYETNTSHVIRVRSTDRGGLWRDQEVTISVTNVNETPTDIVAPEPITILEHSASGVVLCSLTTADPDVGDSHSYTLLDDAGGRFALHDNQVVVANGSLLDYATNPSHVIRVRTADGGGLTYDKDFTIFVTNINHTPTDILASAPVAVPENSPAGTPVCTLTTVDPDVGDQHTYTLLDNAGGRFAVQGNQIVVANGSLLDYETSASHTIRVESADRGGLSYEKNFTVSVTNLNEAPTDISEVIFILPENSPAGTAACDLVTRDPDAGDQHTYTLVDSAGGRFALQGNRVVVANGFLLDYETSTSHVIRVRATDQGGLSLEKNVTISLTDVHDFASPGLFNPATSIFALRAENTSGPADYTFGYGAPGKGWKVLTGDWDGDGAAGVGLYAPESSTFYLTNAYQWGYAEFTFGYGEPGKGWIPLVGDWNGDGHAGVGLYDPQSSTFYLTDSLQSGYAEHTFGYGEPGKGWIPLVGDWNGDGRSGVGLYNPHASIFYLTNTLTTGFAEHTFGYGQPEAGWQPLLGDWNGDRATGVGLYDPHASTFYLTNAFVSGYAEYTFGYGQPGGQWKPLVGDWNGDNRFGVGLYDPSGSTFFLTNQLTTGIAEYTIQFGQPNAGLTPITGCWKTVAASAPAPTAALDPAAVDQLDLADLAAHELAPPFDV